MERHLDHPPELVRPGPIDAGTRALAVEMQDRPWAFVEVYMHDNDFAPEHLRFERDESEDDRAFRAHIGRDRYYALAGGTGRYWLAAALAAVTVAASLIAQP